MTQKRPAVPPVVQQEESKYTWQDTIALIGQDLAPGEEHVADEVITPTAVSRYCEVWEMGNPIYWYQDAAKQAGYRGVVVPWSSIKQTFSYGGAWRPGEPTRFPLTMDKDATARLGAFGPVGKPLPKPTTTVGIFTDMEIEFFEPVCVGDRITVKGNKLINVRVRETRIGLGAFTNRESEWYNHRGELVARANQGGYAYDARKQS